jgi:hypothetical protein
MTSGLAAIRFVKDLTWKSLINGRGDHSQPRPAGLFSRDDEIGKRNVVRTCFAPEAERAEEESDEPNS